MSHNPVEFYTDENGRELVNITTIDYFYPLEVNSASIGISILFLIIFILLYLVIIGFLLHVRRRKVPVPRNAKGLFTLIGIFIGIQIMHVSAQIISDSLNIRMRMNVENGYEISKPYFVLFSFFQMFPLFLMMGNGSTLFLIINFVQTIFLKTSFEIRAISHTSFKRAKVILFILAAFSTILTFVATLISATFHLLLLLQILPPIYLRFSTIVGFPIGCTMFLIDSILTLISGIVVIKAIRKNSSKAQQKRGRETRRLSVTLKEQSRPFIVTICLICGILFSVFLQQIGGTVFTVIGISDPLYFKFVWQVLTSLGVVACSLLSMGMFYPMFVHAVRARKTIESQQDKGEVICCSPTGLGINSIRDDTFRSTIGSENPHESINEKPKDSVIAVSPISTEGGGIESEFIVSIETPEYYHPSVLICD